MKAVVLRFAVRARRYANDADFTGAWSPQYQNSLPLLALLRTQTVWQETALLNGLLVGLKLGVRMWVMSIVYKCRCYATGAA